MNSRNFAVICFALAAAQFSVAGPLGDPMPLKSDGARGVVASGVPAGANFTTGAVLVAPAPVVVAPKPVTFNVLPSDTSFRLVIGRWARANGWSFEPEHWTVARDIPVAGVAALGGDFKVAVRDLLSATEMTDLPVKPCFYSNSVVRVVSQSTKCDSTKE